MIRLFVCKGDATMTRLLFAAIMLALSVVACNLESDTATPTPTDIPAETGPFTIEGEPINGTVDTTNDAILPASGECVPRQDWQVYIVQPGDNLTFIAERVGSTLEELVAANCIENPDALDRGTELRVPRLPDS
jgi:hypothetical protein